MHAKMVLVMFGTLFAGQILLFMWRKKHPRSYNLGMLHFIIPPIIPMMDSLISSFLVRLAVSGRGLCIDSNSEVLNHVQRRLRGAS